MDRRTVAIIGGGASATLLIAHLARHPEANSLHIDVYDRGGRFAKGIAYSTLHDCHLLNVRASNMSAYQEEKEHFADWAAAYGFLPLDFVPRKLYGLYLSERLQDAKKKMEISCIEKDVMACVKNEQGFSVRTKDGVRDYDDVILASGNVRPLRPHVEGDVPEYFDDPWRADFERLLKAKTIALIGSGLTAVDIVLALGAKGYSGKILVFSRNALLPATHVDPVAIPLDLEEGYKSPLKMLRFVRTQIKQAHTRDIPWQAVIDALRPHTNPLWQDWNARDRRQFSKRLMTFWNVHRHRMAPQISAYVRNKQKEGQLHFIKVGVKSVGSGPALSTTAGLKSVDAVINCLGYRYDEEGRTYEVTYRIGPAMFGELFETTAIPEIRAQAHALAQKLLPQK